MNALRSLTALILSTFLLGVIFGEAAGAERPNILHIHADDFRADCLGALGHPVVKTPNLDTLVRTGLTLKHCYTMGSMVGAVCQPSRTMLLTGKSWQRIPRPNQGDPEASLPKVLSRAGYETWHCGKGGNEYTVGLKAFDTNLTMNDPSIDLRRGSSQRHADATIDFLNKRKGEKPFYLYVAPSVPHDPRVAPPEFHRMYPPDEMPLPPAFLPQHPFDNGDMLVRDETLAPFPRTADDTKRQLADYYACISALDFHVGRIFEQLKKMDAWANTIVIFTGDNGLSVGDHGLFGKQNLYEFGGMHVPCVIAGPGVRHETSDALVYLMDLFPTMVELAGAELPKDVDGRSFAALLAGKPFASRAHLYTGYKNCQRSMRDARWKLIRYPEVDQTQLFDLQQDPHERTNLAGQIEHQDRVARMLKSMQEEMKRYDDPCPLSIPNPKPARWTPPAK